MGDKTGIQWADATWNPVTGCTKISPGCKFCYAERITERFGQDFSKIVLHPDRLDQPLRWKKPRRIFVNSMSDLFHEEIPDEFIGQTFCMMMSAWWHTFQVLTKRAQRMMKLLQHPPMSFPVGMVAGGTLKNVHLGVSCEDQQRANERIPLLLQTPAAVRFVSLEPLLGPIQLTGISSPQVHFNSLISGRYPALDLVIVGGESGGPPERALVKPERVASFGGVFVGAKTVWRPKPEALAWVRSIRDQCVSAGVPFFFKQFGGPTPKSGGRILGGREWNEMPIIAPPSPRDK